MLLLKVNRGRTQRVQRRHPYISHAPIIASVESLILLQYYLSIAENRLKKVKNIDFFYNNYNFLQFCKIIKYLHLLDVCHRIATKEHSGHVRRRRFRRAEGVLGRRTDLKQTAGLYRRLGWAGCTVSTVKLQKVPCYIGFVPCFSLSEGKKQNSLLECGKYGSQA